jgi:two-component system, OmpR family, response regulator
MRVLLIEDEQKIAKALQRALEQEKYAVDVTHDADTGYAMMTTEPYDLAVIDRLLPGNRDGIAIIKDARAQGIHTPTLLLTALGSVKDRTTGLDAGADDYLVKPFALEELLARIRALLRRPAEQQGTILTAGDLTLDTISFTAKRGGKEIFLTNKEYSLLEYLLRNQGRPLSKSAIIAHVWDFDSDILPNTVEVYIKYLRSKIDVPFSSPLIKTVRGFGYTIDSNKSNQ